VASCLPFVPAAAKEQAPGEVNLLELVAGIVLTHDALHPGEPLYIREALAEYGVEADHLAVHNIAKKLRRRHRLIIEGEPRQPGYVLKDWLWTARRTKTSVGRVALDVAVATDSELQTDW